MPPIDPNISKGVILVIIAGIVILAFTYLIEFLLPLLVAVGLFVIAYLIYKFFTTGTLGF